MSLLSNHSLHDSLKDVFTCDYPELKLVGYKNDYLDFIDPKCMKYPIMQGKDDFGRPFISMKTISFVTSRITKKTLFEFRGY